MDDYRCFFLLGNGGARNADLRSAPGAFGSAAPLRRARLEEKPNARRAAHERRASISLNRAVKKAVKS